MPVTSPLPQAAVLGSLRVAVVAPPWFELPPPAYGGIEAVCSYLVAGLLRRGNQVTLIGAGRNGTAAAFVPTFRRPQCHRLGQAVPELLHATALPAILERLEVDVVHDHSLAGPLMTPAHGVPTVATVHVPVTGESGEFYRRIADLAPSVGFVAISEAQRRGIADLPWLATVYNAIDPHAYPLQPKKDNYVLFLGRICPEKGATTAIAVARAAGLRLVLAGKCREQAERHYFDECIAPLLGEGVEWVGEVGGAHKLDLLGRARCLLFPIAWDEPFGMVMIEAMACGTPVVALRRGSVPEVVRHGETGFVCDDLDQMVEAVHAAALLDPFRCRAEIESRFSADRMAAAYECAYRAVLQGAASPDAPMRGSRRRALERGDGAAEWGVQHA